MKPTKKNRYLIWTIIWGFLFFGILAVLPFYYFWYLPLTLVVIITLALIKDAVDFYLIGKGLDSLWHKWFEHLPLSIMILLFGLYNLVKTNDLGWTIVVAGSLIDAIVDWYQDQLCCWE